MCSKHFDETLKAVEAQDRRDTSIGHLVLVGVLVGLFLGLLTGCGKDTTVVVVVPPPGPTATATPIPGPKDSGCYAPPSHPDACN